MLANLFHAGALYFGVSLFFIIVTLFGLKWIYDIKKLLEKIVNSK